MKLSMDSKCLLLSAREDGEGLDLTKDASETLSRNFDEVEGIHFEEPGLHRADHDVSFAGTSLIPHGNGTFLDNSRFSYGIGRPTSNLICTTCQTISGKSKKVELEVNDDGVPTMKYTMGSRAIWSVMRWAINGNPSDDMLRSTNTISGEAVVALAMGGQIGDKGRAWLFSHMLYGSLKLSIESKNSLARAIGQYNGAQDGQVSYEYNGAVSIGAINFTNSIVLGREQCVLFGEDLIGRLVPPQTNEWFCEIKRLETVDPGIRRHIEGAGRTRLTRPLY
jgi:hypothetical protein